MVPAIPPAGLAQPRPGDVVHEYLWTKTDGDAGGAVSINDKAWIVRGVIKRGLTVDCSSLRNRVLPRSVVRRPESNLG